MSADNKQNNTNTNNIIPYETLKASLDQAAAELEAASAAFYEAVHREDPPLLIKIALNNFDAAHAAVNARTNAMVREYGHLSEVTQNIQHQRDEANRKLEAMRKTVRQLKKLDLDDEDETKGTKDSKDNSNNAKAQNSQGKKRKK